ncbi:MAG: phosphomannomutase, partial [Bacteroidota bacterium]|nr:phosphomannomutase [Bacteroidota bacterium]
AGGEGSGGVIIPSVHYGRDALAGICVVLNEFADFKGKVSDYRKTLPEYHIVKDKIEVNSSPDKVFSMVTAKYKTSGCRMSMTDGLKLDFPDYWIHLRKSNTEPIIRIITEAKTKAKAESLQKNFVNEVRKMLSSGKK